MFNWIEIWHSFLEYVLGLGPYWGSSQYNTFSRSYRGTFTCYPVHRCYGSHPGGNTVCWIFRGSSAKTFKSSAMMARPWWDNKHFWRWDMPLLVYNGWRDTVANSTSCFCEIDKKNYFTRWTKTLHQELSTWSYKYLNFVKGLHDVIRSK